MGHLSLVELVGFGRDLISLHWIQRSIWPHDPLGLFWHVKKINPHLPLDSFPCLHDIFHQSIRENSSKTEYCCPVKTLEPRAGSDKQGDREPFSPSPATSIFSGELNGLMVLSKTHRKWSVRKRCSSCAVMFGGQLMIQRTATPLAFR